MAISALSYIQRGHPVPAAMGSPPGRQWTEYLCGNTDLPLSLSLAFWSSVSLLVS